MADISTITDLSGTTYSLKDSTARDSLVPSGGSDGQVLTRVGSQGAYAWQDPSGGGNVNTVNQISPDANKNVQTMVELTQAQYDALPASKNSDNVAYYITDGSFPEPTASTVSYDNTQSGMQATTVQGALDELNSNSEWKAFHDGSYSAGTAAEISLPTKWDELNVFISMEDGRFGFSFQVCKPNTFNEQAYRQGFYVDSSDNSRAHFMYYTTNKIKITDAQARGVNLAYRVLIAYK